MPATDWVETFFRDYARDNASNDLAATLRHFAPTFLAGGPQGLQCVALEDFAKALPRRKQLFHGIGHHATSFADLQVTHLDNRFALARTGWNMQFTPPAGPLRAFLVHSTFLVDGGGDAPSIVLYLAHQDIFALLREADLLPA